MPQLSDFKGQWALHRWVRDETGPDARFEGLANFIPDTLGVHLSECGTLELDGQGAFQAERAYRWAQSGPLIHVAFDDGRFFHGFNPALDCPTAEHDCPPDFYQVAYDFTRWPLWQSVWTVKGPRKDYVMTSRYMRTE